MKNLAPTYHNDFFCNGINKEVADQIKNSLLGVPSEIKEDVLEDIKSVEAKLRTKVVFSIIKKIELAQRRIDFKLMNAAEYEIKEAASLTVKIFSFLHNRFPERENDKLLKLFYRQYNIAGIPKTIFSEVILKKDFYDSFGSYKFWVKRIKNTILQNHQQLARRLNLVGKNRAKFVTSKAIDNYHETVIKQKEFANSNVIINNNTGETFPLPELPLQYYRKYSEILSFVNGLNEYAFDHNYSAASVTITAPRKFHSKLDITADTPTPCVAKKWLLDRWQCYTNLVRQWPTNSFTFRIIDPHQDGTPHFHALLYFPSDMADRHKSALINAFELKSIVNTKRFEWEDIDYTDNYALRYIVGKLKPVIDSDNNFDSSNDVVRRAAFLATWNMRSHDFTGIPSITRGLWNELRSKKYPFKLPFPLKQLKTMAVENRFADFLELLLEHKQNISMIKDESKKNIGIQWQNSRFLSYSSDCTIIPIEQVDSGLEEKTIQTKLKKPRTTNNKRKSSSKPNINLSKQKPKVDLSKPKKSKVSLQKTKNNSKNVIKLVDQRKKQINSVKESPKNIASPVVKEKCTELTKNKTKPPIPEFILLYKPKNEILNIQKQSKNPPKKYFLKVILKKLTTTFVFLYQAITKPARLRNFTEKLWRKYLK